MKKIVIVSILLCVYLSCDKEQPDTSILDQNHNVQSNNITAADIESIEYVEYVLSDASTLATSSWTQFNQFSIYIEDLKGGKITFFTEDQDILKNFMLEMKAEVPESLNSNSITSRLLALETSAYKLHDEAVFNQSDKTKLLETIGEVLKAKSNLNFQINKKFEKDAQKIQKPL